MWYEGEWKEGANISFFDKKHGGTKVIIEELKQNELIRTKHIAMVDVQNKELELTDEMMKRWIGSREDFYFTVINENETKLKVVLEADDVFEPMMQAWNLALGYIKEICEREV